MIQPTGPKDAKIVLVGEAPGETEEKQGVPFVGMAGMVLNGILEEVGIPREQCYITNVMLTRPEGNAFSKFYEKSKPSAALLEGYERLRNELASIRPNVIVALGNEPMKALLGFGGIEDWRGSVIESPLGKVIPTIHPAAISRMWSFRPASVCDFQRIRENSFYPEVRRTKRDLVICYDTNQALNEINKLMEAEYVSFDIETETEQITCIGLASGPRRAVCIPFWYGQTKSFRSVEDEARILEALKRLLEAGNIGKVAHNGAYDIQYIKRCWGIHVENLWLDTMLAFHTLYPELPKGLGYLTSIYTDHPYYKFNRTTGDADVHFNYNATDACVTYECFEAIIKELREDNLEAFYREYVHALIDPLVGMEERGVCFDNEKRNALRATYRKEVDALKTQFVTEVGHEINPASPDQITEWLYEELKLPKKVKLRKESGERTVTADERALEKLYTDTKLPALQTLLRIREISKVYSTYLGIRLDDDKRVRCSFLVTGTETGRLSSRTTARGTGTNLQNIPVGEIRSLFKADDGNIFVNADLSQAEARVVAYISGEERLIRVFEEGGDIHRKNAANIFRKQESEVTDEERQLAKRVIHASNYGMGPRTFSETAGIPEAESKRLLNQYFATYPKIRLWHQAMGARLKTRRELRTPFGRRRIFFNKWDASLLKEALAFIPQSTVADIVNQALIELYKIQLSLGTFELLLQVHDSILVQTPVERVEETIEVIRKAMTRPLEINGRIMVIPVDFKIGYNWNELKKVV